MTRGGAEGGPSWSGGLKVSPFGGGKTAKEAGGRAAARGRRAGAGGAAASARPPLGGDKIAGTSGRGVN